MVTVTKGINLEITISVILLVLALLMAQQTNFDIWLQNYFFNFTSHSWLINKDEPIKKFLFYKLPKALFGILITALLFYLFFNKTKRCKTILTLLGLILIPLLVGNIKKFTNIYCPSQLDLYDGNYPYIRIFNKYPSTFIQNKKGQCFPAGHAITGFSFIILYYVFDKKSLRITVLITSIIIGWILGLYQMLKGAHFFSDTLVSMICCFLMSAIIAKIYFKFKPH